MGIAKSTARQRSSSGIGGPSGALADPGRNSGPPHYRPIDTTPYGSIKSSSASSPCKVKFINHSGQTLRVSWINFEGHRVTYAILAGSGHCCKLSSFSYHPWVVERATGDVYAVYIGESAVVTIRGRNDFTVRQSTRNHIPWKKETRTNGQIARSKFSNIRSSPSARCTVQFVNRSAEALTVSWLNYRGNKVLYKTLVPGGSYRQSTFTEHPWILEAESGENGEFYAMYVGGTAVVTVIGKNHFTATQPSGHNLPPASPSSKQHSATMMEVLKNASSACTTSSMRSRRACSKDSPDCTICCEPLADSVWSLRCGHVFHGECLGAACRVNMECPICRTSINGSQDLRKIFLN